MPDVKGKVLPIYFVADESGSMSSLMSELNQGLVSLLDALNKEPMAAAKIRLSVVGFADDALCYLSIADLREVEKMPTLTARGATSYSSAFEAILAAIPVDAKTLKEEGFRVHRPAVFFLTDGQPTDDGQWEGALQRLKSPEFQERPNILAFGIGQADARTIVRVASREDFAFIAARGVDTGTAIAKFVEALTHSIVSSGQTIAGANPELVVEKPATFTMAVDEIDPR